MKPRKRPYLGCAALIVAPVLLIAVFWGYQRLTDASDRDHPAADAPADLCASVGDDLAATLVPDATRTAGATYSSGPDAACQWDTAQPRTGGYGSLWVRILRHGQVSGVDGTSRADGVFGDGCEAIVSNYQATGLAGLGDESCVATEDSADGTAHADLVTRRGADIVWVRYYVNPGEDVRQRAVDVAAKVLAAT